MVYNYCAEFLKIMTKISAAVEKTIEIVEAIADVVLGLLTKNNATLADLQEAKAEIAALTAADEESATLIDDANSKLSELLEIAKAAVVPAEIATDEESEDLGYDI